MGDWTLNSQRRVIGTRRPTEAGLPAGLTPALSWQSLSAALAVRRFKDLTFQEEYNTLFPSSAQP